MAYNWKVKVVEFKHQVGIDNILQDGINNAINTLMNEENVDEILDITAYYDDDRDVSIAMIFYKVEIV